MIIMELVARGDLKNFLRDCRPTDTSGALLSLLTLPLAVPVLVFGARATEIAIKGGDPAEQTLCESALMREWGEGGGK